MNSILVVDDEAVSRKVTSKYLSKFGFTVEEAINGKEALERFNSELDLAIIDVNLPDMSGLDLLENLRIQNPQLSFIIVSGNPPNETAVKLQEASNILFYQKPFKMATLVEEVKKMLTE